MPRMKRKAEIEGTEAVAGILVGLSRGLPAHAAPGAPIPPATRAPQAITRYNAENLKDTKYRRSHAPPLGRLASRY